MTKYVLIGMIVAVLSSRATRDTWNGVTFGDSGSEVIGKFGTPDTDFDSGIGVRLIRYPQMTVVLRHDCVYSITFQGNHALLFTEACLAFGVPTFWAQNADWQSSNSITRLYGDELTIWQNR